MTRGEVFTAVVLAATILFILFWIWKRYDDRINAEEKKSDAATSELWMAISKLRSDGTYTVYCGKEFYQALLASPNVRRDMDDGKLYIWGIEILRDDKVYPYDYLICNENGSMWLNRWK